MINRIWVLLELGCMYVCVGVLRMEDVHTVHPPDSSPVINGPIDYTE
jgi:hypothetical protein